MSNYRPISILPILSKLFEKQVSAMLYEHLVNNNMLHSPFHHQSGFRKKCSTETALIRLINQLLLDLDKNKVSGLLFIDYKEAFNLINHEILLDKLITEYGFDSKESALNQRLFNPSYTVRGVGW